MNTREANEERLYDIVDGPGKDKLFDACKYAYSGDSKVTVKFVVSLGTTMPKGHPGSAYILMPVTGFRINGIQHENGSGEGFNLQGLCKAAQDSGTFKLCKFKAYYNSKSRKGRISFIER